MSHSTQNIRTRQRMTVMLFAVLLFLSIFTGKLFAQQVRLDWQTVADVNPQGEFTLALAGDVPATVTAFEFVITYDSAQVSYSDYALQVAGMNATVNDDGAGTLTLRAEGDALAEGYYNFVNLSFRSLAAGNAAVTLARSSFVSTSGQTIPATMMLSHQIYYQGAEITVSETTTAASASTVASSASTLVSQTAVTSTAVSSGNSPVSSMLTNTSQGNAEQEESGSGSGLKIFLLLASVVVLALILLILKLQRDSGVRRPRIRR